MVGASRLMLLRLPLLSPKYGILPVMHVGPARVGHSLPSNKTDGFLLACNINGMRQNHSGNRGMMGTTVLCVRKNQTVVIIGDGQVTLGSEIVKPNARKVRRIGENTIGGFAGATADAFTLFERLENQLEEHSGMIMGGIKKLFRCRLNINLTRAAVELAKLWRTDKFLRRLDAVMVVADSEISLTITGNGDVLEPHDGVIAIGSGGSYAVAAARALIDMPNMDAEAIARKAMKIAADSCIYTNHNFIVESISAATTSSLKADSEVAALSDSVCMSDDLRSVAADSTSEGSVSGCDSVSNPIDKVLKS